MRYVHFVERAVREGPQAMAARTRRLRRIRVRNLIDEHTSSTALPWFVISQFGALGRLSLDTKERNPPGSLQVTAVCCVRRSLRALPAHTLVRPSRCSGWAAI